VFSQICSRLRPRDGLAPSLIRLTLTLWIFAAGVGRLQGDLLELPATPPDPEQLARLSRTLNLLRSATPENRRPVRIIFFGQSITRQVWWLDVRKRLIAAYPHAELEVLNQAISGFAAEYLSQMVDTHVAAYRPDLVILDDYGYEKEMMELVGRLATRTHADILLQTDHIHQLSGMNEPTDPALLTTPTTWAQRNYVMLPRVAERYGACLADIRDRWRDYLRQHSLVPADLQVDNIHLNADGNALMAALVWRYLSPEAAGPWSDPENDPRVRTLVVGRDLHWQGDALSMEFTGEDVEVVTHSTAPLVRVRVDNQTPSDLPALYEHTIASPTHERRDWPAVLEIDAAAPLVPEDWELTITEAGAGVWDFKYRVDGSTTGFDGGGDGYADFRSNSGRVLIRRDSFALPIAANWTQVPVPVGFKVRWSSRFHGMDSFLPTAPPRAGGQPSFRLARGLSPGSHRLDLISGAFEGGGIRLVRIYSLSREATASQAAYDPPLRLRVGPHKPNGGMELFWPTNYPNLWPVSGGDLSDTANWQPVPGEATSASGYFRLRLPAAASSGVFQLRPRPAPESNEQSGQPSHPRLPDY
jgi:hypothetical protein